MKRALVVEDDPRIADLCVRLLAQSGFEARAVATGREALESLASDAASLAVLYVDVGLPDMSGLDVAEHARRVRPDLPIVVASGSPDAMPPCDAVALVKPFSIRRFQEAVDRAMRRS